MTRVDESQWMSLDEIEAFSRDTIVRAGAEQAAAGAVAWSVRIAELLSRRDKGLERLARLLEGLRMGGINGTVREQTYQRGNAQLHMDVRGGFSDLAMSNGMTWMRKVAESEGAAVLSLSRSGDLPVLCPWLSGLARAKLIALGLSDLPDGQTSVYLPHGKGASRSVLNVPTTDAASQWIGPLLSALGAEDNTVARHAHMPFDAPEDRGAVIFALKPARAWLETAEAQEADLLDTETTGVAVPSNLLERIITI